MGRWNVCVSLSGVAMDVPWHSQRQFKHSWPAWGDSSSFIRNAKVTLKMQFINPRRWTLFFILLWKINVIELEGRQRWHLSLSLSHWRRRRRWSGGGGGAWLRFVQAAVPHQGEKKKKSSALFTLYHPVRNAGRWLCVSGASASLVGTLELRTTRSELEGHIAAKWLMSHLYWPANLRSAD